MGIGKSNNPWTGTRLPIMSKLKITGTILVLILVFVSPTYAQSPKPPAVAVPEPVPSDPVPPTKLTTREIVVGFANQYQVSSTQMLGVMKCESGGNQYAWNKNDPGVGSKGIFQFQTSTFYKYAKELHFENPDIWSIEQQAEIAAYMFKKGQQLQWYNCYKKITA